MEKIRQGRPNGEGIIESGKQTKNRSRYLRETGRLGDGASSEKKESKGERGLNSSRNLRPSLLFPLAISPTRRIIRSGGGEPAQTRTNTVLCGRPACQMW